MTKSTVVQPSLLAMRDAQRLARTLTGSLKRGFRAHIEQSVVFNDSGRYGAFMSLLIRDRSANITALLVAAVANLEGVPTVTFTLYRHPFVVNTSSGRIGVWSISPVSDPECFGQLRVVPPALPSLAGRLTLPELAVRAPMASAPSGRHGDVIDDLMLVTQFTLKGRLRSGT